MSGRSPSPSLKDVETWMVSAITSADADADADATELERLVTASERMTAVERFDIYRNGYRLRLVECLEDDYPTLARLVRRGRTACEDEAFTELCHAYIARHPSTSPNLNFFGRHMSAFCREYGAARDAAARKRWAFAAELAALEWALVEALHAEIAPPLDAAHLEKIPVEEWAAARFVPSDAVRLYRFEHPVNAFFQACVASDELPEIPGGGASAVAVYRHDLRIWRMDLTPAMVVVLAPLLEGKTIGDALERLEAEVTDADKLAEAARSLGVWFREWSSAGFFTRVVRGAE